MALRPTGRTHNMTSPPPFSRVPAAFAKAELGKTKTKRKRKRAPAHRPPPKPVLHLLDPRPIGHRVVLHYPPALLSPNARPNRWEKAQVTRSYRMQCYYDALAASLRIPHGIGADDPIGVRLDFFPPSTKRLDDDNAEASFKAGRDGIAQALKVDDARFVVSRHMHSEVKSCVVVTLSPVQRMEGLAHG